MSKLNSRRLTPLMLVLVLIVLHQDYWNWSNARLVGGFLPMGLFYHLLISIAAAVVWYLATAHCWPIEPPSAADHGHTAD